MKTKSKTEEKPQEKSVDPRVNDKETFWKTENKENRKKNGRACNQYGEIVEHIENTKSPNKMLNTMKFAKPVITRRNIPYYIPKKITTHKGITKRKD